MTKVNWNVECIQSAYLLQKMIFEWLLQKFEFKGDSSFRNGETQTTIIKTIQFSIRMLWNIIVFSLLNSLTRDLPNIV